MPYLYSPERYARSVATIQQEADHHNRDLTDFGWYAYVFVSMDDDPTVAATAARNFFGNTYRDDFQVFLDRVACVGTPEQVTERLRAFVRAGARHLIVVPCARQQETYHRVLTEIRPQLEQ
jgi:alkanesulfonate monooxygenase SsuD/methylene tetrahydromethanopterin reductase-like flavin-dependent oxidoreductase (luciferase family)